MLQSDWMPTDHEWEQAGYRIEQYQGDAANVRGRARLAPESTAALMREIERAGQTPAPRPARGPLMQQRLARARRDMARRYGNVA